MTCSKTIILGLSKSGTTGHYQSLKTALKSSHKDIISLYEPRKRKVLDSAIKNSLHIPLLVKAMIQHLDLLNLDHENFTHRVAVVRDPRDLLVSLTVYRPLISNNDISRLTPLLDLYEQKVSNPSAVSLRSINDMSDDLGLKNIPLDELVQQYMELQRLSERYRYFISRYEDFVTGNLHGLMEYTGLSLTNTAVEEGWTGHVVRSKTSGHWRDWMTAEDVDFYRARIESIIRAFAYEDEWDINSTPKIDRATSIEYIRSGVQRVNDERLALRKSNHGEYSAESLKLLQDAAGDGSVKDILALGRYYLRSAKSNEENAKLAVYWFELGALLGSKKAAKALMRLCSKFPEHEPEHLRV